MSAALTAAALIVAAAVPLAVLACTRGPAPLTGRRARADRALLRLARTGCDRPTCPTCSALSDRAQKDHR